MNKIAFRAFLNNVQLKRILKLADKHTYTQLNMS